MFSNPYAEPRRLTYSVWNRFRGLDCGRWKNPGKKKPSKHFWCAISHIRGKNPWGIVTKFSMWVDIREIITYATFGNDGFGRGKGSNFPFSRWLVSSPLQHSHTNYRASVWWSMKHILKNMQHKMLQKDRF